MYCSKFLFCDVSGATLQQPNCDFCFYGVTNLKAHQPAPQHMHNILLINSPNSKDVDPRRLEDLCLVISFSATTSHAKNQTHCFVPHCCVFLSFGDETKTLLWGNLVSSCGHSYSRFFNVNLRFGTCRLRRYLKQCWPDSLTHICGTRERWFKTPSENYWTLNGGSVCW